MHKLKSLTRAISRTIFWIGGVSLCLLGIAYLCIGAHDALLASRREERLAGVVTLVGGIALLAGLVLYRVGVRGRRAATVFVVGVAPAVLLIAIQVSFRPTRLLVLWILAALVPLFVAVRLFRKSPKTSAGTFRINKDVLVTSAVSIAVALVGLLGGTFRPIEQASTVDISVTSSVVGQRGDAKRPFTVVKTRVELDNEGPRQLVLLGSTYSLTATENTPRRASKLQQWSISEEIKKQDGWSGQYETEQRLNTFEVGIDELEPGTLLDPGEQVVREIYSVVDNAAGNTVLSCYGLVTARSERMVLGEQGERAGGEWLVPMKEQKPANFAGPTAAEWRVEATGWIARLTRGRPMLTVSYLPVHDEDSKILTDVAISYGVVGSVEGQASIEDWKPSVANFYGTAATNGCSSVVVDLKAIPDDEQGGSPEKPS